MSQWTGASESGILRKKTITENHEELLVFGYACKLFRDDEKALYIDQGKHLIPWMGDDSLKIDRYDGRGTLSDLTKYEASREGYDAMRWLGLSEKERNIEELCDKERYYSLIINEEEEQMYKDEEIKRKNTNAIQYSYDVPQNPEISQEGIPTVPEEDEEYVPPPVLDVPVDIQLPKTVKENVRIEKTALFVCRQGPQMEILIKAKQGDNPQFSFLNQDHKLYKFYRHVLAAFKTGRYQGFEVHTKSKTENQMENSEQDSTSHYLHPSLMASTSEPAASTAITIPQIAYKPSVNCAYSQLVNRIQGTQTETQDGAASASKIPDYAQMTYEQQQYYQYYYVQQYYEYYKQLALFQQGQGGNPGQFAPPTDFQNLDPSIQHYIQQMAYSQYLQHHQQANDNSYAQIVSNVNKESNPYAANVPQVPQTVSNTIVTSKSQTEERTVTLVNDVIVKKPLLSLAAYGSGSDSDTENSSDEGNKPDERIVTVVKPDYSVPSGEIQIVIDKMVYHVSRNGEQFEEILKAKNDPRFEFLKEEHEFNKYYKEKLKELKEGSSENGNKAGEDKEEKSVKEVKKAKKERRVIAPVSFSIKKAKEEQPKEIKSALPVEESDEEEEAPVTATPATTTQAIQVPKNIVYSLSNPPPSLTSVLLKIAAENQKKVDQETLMEIKTEKTEELKKEIEATKTDFDEDPILEMIELTEGLIDKKDTKRAEDKIKDKLAAAAREKLAAVTRDRALQLERKKRAAAFLKLKTGITNQPSEASTEKTEQIHEVPSSSPLRRDSIEIIEIDSEDPSPKKKKNKRDRDKNDRVKNDRDKNDRDKNNRDKNFDKERSASRPKERRKDRKKDKGRRRSYSSDEEEEEENRKRRDDEKRSKRKKYKRKHSRSHRESRSKKSKKRPKKSESEGSGSTASNS